MFPEQVGEDLERDDVRGYPQKKKEIADSQWSRNSVRSVSAQK